VVFTEKTFRVVSCGLVDVGFQDLGIRGTEELEVDFGVTRAYVETSLQWRLMRKDKSQSSSEILNFLYYFVSLSVYNFKKITNFVTNF
jgi:hypothetical protein